MGIRDLLRVQVLSGLKEGDRVVVEGHDTLKEDGRVTVKERPADKREPQPDSSQPGNTTSL